MVYRHSIVTRITHATFFLSFMGLAVSGAQMYFHRHWIPIKVPVLHQYLGLAMLAGGVIYLISGLVSGQLGKLIFTEDDLGGLWPMAAYYLRLREQPPNYGEYNPLQKLAYTLVLFVFAPLIVLTGLALSPGVDSAAPWLTAVFGGRQFARLWHFVLMIALCGFGIMHVILVATTGLRNHLTSMITGRYRLGAHDGVGV